MLAELGANPNATGPKHSCGPGGCDRIDLPLLFHAADGVGVDKDVKTEALLAAGADPLVKDADGSTPLVRAVASLCSGAPDYPVSFRSFFEGLSGLRRDRGPTPEARERFVAEALPLLRAYVERFAAGIPYSEGDEFAAQWREEAVACISVLCAYEAWWRGQARRSSQ